jgi:hypothetical protein
LEEYTEGDLLGDENLLEDSKNEEAFMELPEEP